MFSASKHFPSHKQKLWKSVRTLWLSSLPDIYNYVLYPKVGILSLLHIVEGYLDTYSYLMFIPRRTLASNQALKQNGLCILIHKEATMKRTLILFLLKGIHYPFSLSCYHVTIQKSIQLRCFVSCLCTENYKTNM